jgi:hypothetical protein
VLHVTNGTSVSLPESGLGGEVLVWIDVLHEGPVPAGLDEAELARVRGRFLDSIWPHETSFIEELQQRDTVLERSEEVVLWFEHDLFDQLQLIQILDTLGSRNTAPSLICIDRYLGCLTGAELAALWPERRAVTAAQLDLASAAWQAFRSPDPMAIAALLRQDTAALPFLAGALERHLQQFPAIGNGLSRTEQQILEAVDAGHRDFHSLFPAEQAREERIFMGDCTLKGYVDRMIACRYPLLAEDGGYRLTAAGREVLAGRADHVKLSGVDRWLGGVHLRGGEALWRWDERARRLVPQ